jgi:hypothetical protein
MIESATGEPFTELAIKKDAAGFAKAYTDLTDRCNSCHQARRASALGPGFDASRALRFRRTN